MLVSPYYGTVRYQIETLVGNTWSATSSSDYRLSQYESQLNTYGELRLLNHISFLRAGTYRIKVYDANNSSLVPGYSQTITVGQPTTHTVVSIDATTPTSHFTAGQSVDVTINALRSNNIIEPDYRGTLRFEIWTKPTYSSSWSQASYNDYSLSRTQYTFSSSDRGSVRFPSLVTLRNTAYEYALRVYDESNRMVDEVIWRPSSYTNNTAALQRIVVSASNSVPNLNDYVNVSIRLIDTNNNTMTNFTDSVRVEVWKRTNSSYSWTQAPSHEYTLTYPTYSFSVNQRGEVTLTNFIRFHTQQEYQIRVYSNAYNTRHIYGDYTFYPRTTTTTINTPSVTTNSISHFVGELQPSVPSLYDNVHVRVKAKDAYNNNVTNQQRINISIERKLLPTSNLWRAASTVACTLHKDTYTFSYGDRGEVLINDVFSCRAKGFYRLKITDAYNGVILGYIYFTIVDTNDFVTRLSGFDTYQRQEVQEEYRNFMSQVNQWESQYPRLIHNRDWAAAWKKYYVELNKLAYGKDGKAYNYDALLRSRDQFYAAFNRLK